ncbi:MAG: RHS repeat-associated core domain-containing protein [Elusimicrobiales bacterium]
MVGKRETFGHIQDRLSSVTNPLSHAASYGYDAAGRISAAADANGSSFAFAYDILGRLASATAPDGQTTYAYDLAGNLTTVEGPQTKLQFGYDAAGRVTATSAQDKIANLGGAFTYTYDAAGNRLAMTASGYTWSYSYDALNRPVTITAPGGTQFQFTYDAAGRRTRMDMGAAVAADYVYDAANQLTGITYRRKADNAVIAQVGYTYDTAGNRATMADDFGAHTFGYDDLHRLTSAVHPSSGALSVQSEAFAYDAVGNRTSDAVRSGYAYDAANRLNSDSQDTYAYDNNGNLTAKTRTSDNAQTTYVYDAQNRLTQVARGTTDTATYRYDALGRRIAKTVTHNGATVADKHFIYDGEDIAFVTDAAGALKAMYTHGPGTDEPLMLRKGASDYFLLADGLGSIIAIADQTGNIAERTQYQAYGRPVFKNEVTGSTSSWSQTGNLYSYTAREWDAETGLFYYRARYYAPDTGRFIQKDPIGFAGGDPNLYAYVNANPINHYDPSGLFLYPWENAVSIIGGTELQRLAMQIVLNRVFRTRRGRELEDMIRGPWYRHGHPISLEINCAGVLGATGDTIFIDSAEALRLSIETSSGPRIPSLTGIVAHELGHAVTGTRDTGINMMDNVSQNENPIIQELGFSARIKY